MKRTDGNNVAVRSAKECAYLALFVALQIAAQLLFSALPGVEIVTLLFISYSFVFGVRRGTLAATAFALLRQAGAYGSTHRSHGRIRAQIEQANTQNQHHSANSKGNQFSGSEGKPGC